jgi:mono/diheme cytochrome c family protein
MTRRYLVAAAVLLFVIFVLLQLIRPALPPRQATTELVAPPEVRATLHRSCYACHSNEAPLPLLDNVVPAYWLVAHDIREAQEHLDFSKLAKLPAAQQRATLFEAVNQIQLGAMPLPRYLAAHHGAVVTPEELAQLRAYLATPPPAPAPSRDPDPADTQYRAFVQAGPSKQAIALSPNGIAMPADYKNWKPISSTDRWDNGTLRQILGNPVAIKALADGQVNPWPDGTMFAKVAWVAQPADNGEIRAGAFKQVEFMIRDSHRYKDTVGWGWARWLGTDLKPYGKDAHLSGECIGCHTPVRNDDYVYTMPLKGSR